VYGPVEGLIGGFYGLIEVDLWVGDGGDTDADGDGMVMAIVGEIGLSDDLAEAFGEGKKALMVGLGEKEDEFIASEQGEDIGVTELALSEAADLG